MFLNVLVSIIVGGLLGANRLLSAAIFFPPIKQFVLGYPTFSDLLDAFTSLRNHDFIPFGTSYTHGEGWWEYDIFIGFTAFVVISLCLAPALKLAKLEDQLALFSTAGVFLLLSLGTVYSIIVKSRIPFITIERVPSRFIIMPFVLLLIFTLRTLNELLTSISFRRYGFVAIAVLPLIAPELKDHSLLLASTNIEKFQNKIPLRLAILPNTDPIYTFSVYARWFISVISLLVMMTVLFWWNRDRVGVSVAGAREWISRF